MQTKHTTKKASHASVVGAEELYKLSDMVSGLSHDMVCLVTLVEHQIDDVMFPGLTAEGSVSGDSAGSFYYIPPSQKRSIAFLVSKLNSAAFDLDELSAKITDKAMEHRKMLLASPHEGEA